MNSHRMHRDSSCVAHVPEILRFCNLFFFGVQRGTLFERWQCQPNYPQILSCSFGLSMFRFATLNVFRPWERTHVGHVVFHRWTWTFIPRDNLLQGLRREDEELLRPSKEEQEGCCGVEVCWRLLAYLAIWQIQFINWSECNFFFQKGKIQENKKRSAMPNLGALQVWNYWPKCWTMFHGNIGSQENNLQRF